MTQPYAGDVISTKQWASPQVLAARWPIVVIEVQLDRVEATAAVAHGVEYTLVSTPGGVSICLPGYSE